MTPCWSPAAVVAAAVPDRPPTRTGSAASREVRVGRAGRTEPPARARSASSREEAAATSQWWLHRPGRNRRGGRQRRRHGQDRDHWAGRPGGRQWPQAEHPAVRRWRRGRWRRLPRWRRRWRWRPTGRERQGVRRRRRWRRLEPCCVLGHAGPRRRSRHRKRGSDRHLRRETLAACLGQSATIVSKGGGVTRGTPGDDVIVSSKAVDQIRSGAGDDLVCSRGARTSSAW